MESKKTKIIYSSPKLRFGNAYSTRAYCTGNGSNAKGDGDTALQCRTTGGSATNDCGGGSGNTGSIESVCAAGPANKNAFCETGVATNNSYTCENGWSASGSICNSGTGYAGVCNVGGGE